MTYRVLSIPNWQFQTIYCKYYGLGKQYQYWNKQKHEWVSSTGPWTEYGTKATKPISKNELFLRLL